MTGFHIDIHDGAAEADGTFGDGEAGGHAVAEAPDDGIDVASENRVGGAAHSGVCEVAGATREDGFIGSLDVGMGAKDGRDLAIQVAAHGDFLAGGFRMEIQDDGAYTECAQACGFGFGGEERVFERRLDEGAALGLHDGHASFGRFEHHATGAGCVIGVVDGAEQSGFGGEISRDFRLVPDVVAGGDDGSAGAEEIDGDFRCDAFAAGSVLSVDDEEIDSFRLLEDGEARDYGFTAGFADDVAKEEDADGRHGGESVEIVRARIDGFGFRDKPFPTWFRSPVGCLLCRSFC